MTRALLAALYLVSVPGAAAWAQTARVLSLPPSGVSVPLSAPLGAPRSSLAPLAPALTAPGLASPLAAVAPGAAAALAAPAASQAVATEASAADAAPAAAAAAPSAPAGAPAVLAPAPAAASATSDFIAWRGATAAAPEAAAAAANFADGLSRGVSARLAALAEAPRRWLSGLAPRFAPGHGLPGRLIVVEGLDGSGKSTQMKLLKEELESRGLKVVTTSWNSSEAVSEAVKKAKKARTLTPQTFALMNAADLADRVEKTVLPALREGAVVLADRWVPTALARDSVRGMETKWLRTLYTFAPKPDLILYFKLPVATAVSRVLARSEGKVGLSEDFSEARGGKVLGQNYYAVGRDMRFAKDDRENFELFQTRVTDEYRRQSWKTGFRVVDAARSPEEIKADVLAHVDRALARGDGPRRARPFFWGTFAAQLGNFGIQGILASLILALGGTASGVLYVVAATAFADSLGSLLATRLERTPMRTVRLLTAGRAAVLAAIPLLAWLGGLSLPVVVGAFMLDALLRGVVDSASYAHLAMLGGSDEARQKSVNSAYSSKYEIGAVAGPFLVAALLKAPSVGMLLATAFIPLSFLAAALLFRRAGALAAAPPAAGESRGQAVRTVLADPRLRVGLLALLALTLYPLRNVLPQMYATMLFHDPASAGWLVALFGAGGVLGSWLSRPLKKVPLGVWGALGALGTIALAAAGAMSAYAWVVPAILLFSISNMTAKLAVQSAFLSQLPAGKASGVSAFWRFSVKIVAMAVKYMPALAVLAAPAHSFAVVGAALGAFAAAQLLLSRKLSRLALAGALLPAPGFAPPSRPDAAAFAPSARSAFYRDPAADRAKLPRETMAQLLDPEKGETAFYRLSRDAMDARFDRAPVSAGMPEVVLHGNPIVENIKRMGKTIWVEDFDNAGFAGKYGRDIARQLVSLSYFQAGRAGDFLAPWTTESFKSGYLHGLRHPEEGFPGMKKLENGKLAEKQPTTDAYIAANRKKYRELRENPIRVDDPRMLELLGLYLDSIGERDLLERCAVELAGKTAGTTGRWDVTLVLLKPLSAGEDRIMIALKTPFAPQTGGHFGRRVVDAAKLFAPGTLLRAGAFTSGDGLAYYGYQISTLDGKIKKKQGEDELSQVAYSIGAELGRVARLSLDERRAQELEERVENDFDEIVRTSAEIKGEVGAAYSAYVAEAARAR